MNGKILGELMGMWVLDCLGMIYIVRSVYTDKAKRTKFCIFSPNKVGIVVYFNPKEVHMSMNRNDIPILAKMVEGKNNEI